MTKNLFNKATFAAPLLSAVMLVSCQKSASELPEQTESGSNSSSAKISTKSWVVETKRKDGFTNGNPATLFVDGKDPKTSTNAGGPRTELKHKTTFEAGKTSKTLSVSMKAGKFTGTVVIAQLFSKNNNDDILQLRMSGNKLQSHFNKKSKDITTLPTDFFNFELKSNSNGTVSISANGVPGGSFKIAKSPNCIFKTGAYMLGTQGSAKVFINSASVN
jgi:hypothetical protein